MQLIRSLAMPVALAAGVVVGACTEDVADRLDVDVAAPGIVGPLVDLVVYFEQAKTRRYGAGVFHLAQSGVDPTAGPAYLGIRPPDGLDGEAVIYMVACGGPATCTADPVALPECSCEAPRAYGAVETNVAGATRLAVTLVAFNADCDLDGDLFPDCNRTEAGCCTQFDGALIARIDDCADTAPNPGCVGRGCDTRAAHPFRPPELAATEAVTEAELARHSAWCGDGLDNDCIGGDVPCTLADGDGDGFPADVDCDDANTAINPGAGEICGNEIDENCDGVRPACDNDMDGVFADRDCDDADPSRFPGNPEICDDGIDQDCSGEDLLCLNDDLDGDGVDCPFDEPWESHSCGAPGQDCNDLNAGVYPGAQEICGDGIDQDCDGADLPCPADDADGDGARDVAVGGTDCDDRDSMIFPGAREKCGDGIDQDCDGVDLPCGQTPDEDGDGWPVESDCNDNSSDTFPGAPEWCNGLDDDCDGLFDEGNPLATGPGGEPAPVRCGSDCPEGVPCACRAAPVVCTSQGGRLMGEARLRCLGRGPDELAEACNGIDDDCDGQVDDGVEQACYDGPAGSQDVGECRGGVQRCIAAPGEGDATWGDCEGQNLPADEVCDARDNDCEGTVDRDADRRAVTETCFPFDEGQPGAGPCRRGTITCGAGGQFSPCIGAIGPQVDVCDGIDNDCDGQIDENLVRPCGDAGGACVQGRETCVDGRWGRCENSVGPDDEVCDNVDNDCDGEIDEDLVRPCGSDVGECRRGEEECRNGQWRQCRGSREPEPESRCDGRDEDCDGQVDEALTRRCGEDEGRCEEGVEVCDNGDWGACVGAVGPFDEVCNNEDDDCDGRVDEDVTRRCGQDLGACEPGVQRCVDGEFEVRGNEPVCRGAVDPEDEICDGVDNDCDGQIDEAVTRPCGGREGACTPGVQRCAGGVFGVCEGEVRPQGERCDNVDNDCDGEVDEDLLRPCGLAVGNCRPGIERCRAGRWDDCEGAIDPVDERCDAQDNDCDGEFDEDAPCDPAEGDHCVVGLCVCGNSNAPCPDGEACNNGTCE